MKKQKNMTLSQENKVIRKGPKIQQMQNLGEKVFLKERKNIGIMKEQVGNFIGEDRGKH